MSFENFENRESYLRPKYWPPVDPMLEAYKIEYSVGRDPEGVSAAELEYYPISLDPELVQSLETAQADLPLSECILCGDEMVQLRHAEKTADNAWRVECECPNCRLYTKMNVCEERLVEFADHLIDGWDFLGEIEADVVKAHLTSEVEEVLRGIENGQITADDFRTNLEN